MVNGCSKVCAHPRRSHLCAADSRPQESLEFKHFVFSSKDPSGGLGDTIQLREGTPEAETNSHVLASVTLFPAGTGKGSLLCVRRRLAQTDTSLKFSPGGLSVRLSWQVPEETMQYGTMGFL